MTESTAILLEDRGVLRISGPDARSFLQGIVSNDVDKATAERAIWSAFLTPQGKYLHDFFLVEADGALLLEGERARLADLAKRLKLYKLRSKAEVEDVSGLGAAAVPCVRVAGEARRPARFAQVRGTPP